MSTRSILAVALALVVAAWVGVTLKSKASVGVGLRNDRSTNAAQSREPKDKRIDLESPEPANTAQRVDALSGRGRTGALDIELQWWDASPAPDVGIEILPRGERQPFQHIVRDLTDAAGQVSIAAIQPGPITIQVDRASGQASQTNAVVEAGLTQRVTIRLPHLLDVAGRVLDRAGQPVSGATIFATRDQPLAQGESIARSGEDGSYSVRSIDRGFSLFASALGKGASEPVLLSNESKEESSAALSLDLRLDGSTTELAGRVTDPDDRPVSRARVRVWCVPSMNDGEFVEHAPFVTATDVNGEFRASGLSPSGVEVVVDAPEHPLWHGTTRLIEGEEHRFDVHLERGVTITGSVTDEKGNPVDGARIRQVLESRWEHFVSICTSTKTDGTFRLDQIAPGTISLSAEPDTKNSSFRPTVVLEGKPGAELRWDLRLTAGVTIRGRVQDESGTPLVGWRVEGVPLTDIRTFPKPTRTDDAGRFELRGCAPTAYRVSAYAPNERKSRCRLDEVSPGGVDCVLVVEASSRPSAIATGRLLDADGTPVVGATVAGMKTDLGESGGYDKTDSEGRFRIGPMPPAKYLFHFERGNRAVRFFGPVDMHADEEIDLGDVQLDRPGRVELRLHRPDGVPFRKGFGVWLIDEHGFGSIADTKDGLLFVRGSLLPGNYRLECCDDGVATVPVNLVVRPGETTQFETTIPRGSVRELLFRPPAEGSHRKVIHVVVRGSGDFVLERDCFLAPRQPKQPNDETYALFAGFASGHYTYEVNEAYGLHASGDFDVSDSTDDTPPLEIELLRDR